VGKIGEPCPLYCRTTFRSRPTFGNHWTTDFNSNSWTTTFQPLRHGKWRSFCGVAGRKMQ